MATFLLVHGAWHGAWCWEGIVEALEAAGHRAIAIDLPGHGEDPTPPEDVTLASYSEAIRAAAHAAPEAVIAVGHSMGGVMIAQAAHDDPAPFALLVYVAAFVPLDGESLLDLGQQDPDALVSSAIEQTGSTIRFRPERAGEIFYADCSEDVAQRASERLRPNPAAPMMEPVSLAGEIDIPRAYVECTDDRAISLGFQRQLRARVPFERVISMPTSHSPFLSAPTKLAAHLVELSQLAG